MANAESPTPAPGEPSPLPPPQSTKEERTLAMLCHLLALFTGFIGPLVLWLIKKDESPLVDDQGKESLNFQITVLFAYVVAGFTCFLGVGFVLVPAIWIVELVLVIMASVKANEGDRYRYPVCLRLIT